MHSSKGPGNIETIQIPESGDSMRMAGQNIVTVELDKESFVESFQPGRLRDTKGIHYSDVKKGITNKGFANPETTKNARFRVSELARRPLSIEQEEEERIEAEVQRRLNERFEETRQAVAKEGYAAGFAAGKSDARAEIVAEAKPLLERFERTVGEFENMRFEVFKANEELLMQMVYQLAKTVILREINEDRDYTKRLMIHLLERIGARENVKLYLGEKEYSSAEALKDGLVQYFGELKNISIEVDPDIKDAGCGLETDFGEIDARIEVQLESLARTLGATPAASKAKEGA